jgi:hypothetical protein
MKLYFTADAKINPVYSVLFNQTAINIQKIFIDLIESISRQNKDRLDWWVSSPASRDIIKSPLFHYCCCIALFQELIREKKPIPEIITDSKEFNKIIKNYLIVQGITVKVTFVRGSLKRRLKELVRPIYTIFGIPMKQLLLFFTAQLTRSLRKSLPAETLILIDTFVMPGYIEKDRYYPGLLEALSEKEKQRVWFVPHLYGFQPQHFLQVMKRLRKADRNFILKDDFLKFRDYWCLWQHMLRINQLKIKPSFFYGVDISFLVREELTSFRAISSSYAALLNYYFAKRLKDSGIKLKLVIDWFENQNIDRGWNIGFRHFLPEVETIGYQGVTVSSYFLSYYITREEKDSKVIPSKVAVIGKGMVQSARRFCSDLDVCITPAFRFQHVWQERKYFPSENVYTILVALPIMIGEAVHILKLLAHSANKRTDNVYFSIKPHPTTSQTQIQAAFGDEWPERFKFIVGDFNDCVEKSNLLISSASSTCMETMAKGIPVVVVGNNSGLTHNPIPETITSDIWRLCYRTQEIADAIQFYQNSDPGKIKDYKKIGKRIREDYFEPVTRKGVREFLKLSRKREDH